MLGRRHRLFAARERRVVVALLVSFVATLILLPGARAAGRSAPPPSGWQVSDLPAAAGAASSFAEPGIVITSTGTAMVDAATANTGAPPTFWLSRDGAGTWSPGRDVDAAGLSTGDADAAIGADGYLYALNLGYSSSPPPALPSNPTVLVYRSQDGAQWSGPASFPVPHGVDQPDRPWLVLDPRHPADVDVVNSEGGGNIVIWRSTDHGASFTGPTAVTSGANSQAALALSSRPLFDPTDDSRMFVLYETASAAGVAATQTGASAYEFPMTQLWLAASTDAGGTWTNTLVLDAAALADPAMDGTLAHLLVASAVDPSGNLFAAFALRPSAGTSTGIEVIHSSDHGVSWSAPARVPAPTASNVMPALAAGADGHIDVSWYGSPAADYRDPAATWAEMFAQSDAPMAAAPTFTVSQVSGTQPVHVGAIDTAGAVGSDLGDNWGLRDFQSLAIDGCGRPHPVWANDVRNVTQTAIPAPAQGSPAACVSAPDQVGEVPGSALLLVAGAAGALVVGRRRIRHPRPGSRSRLDT
jgi:hypothetical protein